MKNIDIKYLTPSKKYANALFELALENKKTEKVYDDIVFISETISANEQLNSVLNNPVVTIDDKKDIVQKLFAVHIEKITLNFVFLLLEQNRLNCLTDIINCYNHLNNKQYNIINPVIISAVELNREQKGKIISKLENKTNKKVIPEYEVKPDIIGGIIIEIDDKTIDLSIKTKFDNMKRQLIKGNSYGNN